MTVLRSGSATDVGRVRKVNQDLPLEADNLYAVADGMGGHVGGEVAAQVAVDALLEVFTRIPTRAGLQESFSAANQAVWQESQDRSELRGMGTTLTAAALVGGEDGRDTLALANVGDSRAYLYSEGQLVQVTADHSLAEERMRHGEMTEEEAAVHPQRHILTRALGVASEVETDMWELKLRAGDRLLLCSDGLSNELSREELAGVLATVSNPGEAAQRLVDIANEHGGSDNITVVVVDVLVGEEPAPGASVITPVGTRAGVPLVVSNGSTQPAPSSAALADTMAESARMGLTGHVASVERNGTGELLLDHTQAAPVARATVRSAMTPAPPPASPPPNESRGARRRRLGIPRRITIRVVLFVLLVAAVPTGAYFAIRWYAYDNWYLSVQKNEVVILQGHRGGILWFHPRVTDHTHVAPAQLLSTGIAQIRAGVEEPSLHAAQSYVANLRDQYDKVQAVKRKKALNATGAGPDSGPGVTAPPSSLPSSATGAAESTTTTTTAAATATTGTTTSSGTTPVESTTTSTSSPTTVNTTASSTIAP